MIRYYRRTLLDLFQRIYRIQSNPFSNPLETKLIQDKLLSKIVYIENRIRASKAEIKKYRQKLKSNFLPRLSNDEADILKSRIEHLHNQVDEYQRLLVVFRAVGDAIAFIFINDWDIKRLAMKEGAGFISGKDGAEFEKKIFDRAFQFGEIVIRNDLTNCLRYGDITFPLGDGRFALFELKSLEKATDCFVPNKNQFLGMKELLGYFNDSDLPQAIRMRNDVHSKVRRNIEAINHVIEMAISKGSYYEKVEDGLWYYVTRLFSIDEVKQLLTSCCAEPIIGLPSRYQQSSMGYYPFTLSIQNPEALYKFYSHEISIVVLIDFQFLRNYSKLHNIEVECSEDSDMPICLTNLSPTQIELEQMYVGHHFWGRLVAEFLSLDWFANELVYSIKHPPLDQMDTRLGNN